MPTLQIKKGYFLKPVFLLVLFSGFCMGILLLRIIWTDQYRFLFLTWNLFLAWVPLLITLLLDEQWRKGNRNRVYYMAGLSLWLLFLPNAPYIITDLVHLKAQTHVPLWFDSMLIFSYAIAGLQTGLYSLYLAHRMINRLFNDWIGWISIAACVVLSSFGIYLGRVKRWNSWDLFTNPVSLLTDSLQQTTNPNAVKMTLAFTCLLLFFYLLLLSLIHLKSYEPIHQRQK